MRELEELEMNGAKIAVMGAGAVGCYHGGMLALAGEEVVLIGRPALVDAVTARGLIFEKAGGKETVAVQATTSPAAVKGAGLVLVCVKSSDSVAAAEAIMPHLDPGAVVLSLQNGLGNAERIAGVLGRPVLPAVVYVAVEMAGPGHVVHHGRGELVIGEGVGSAAVAARLSAAGIPTEVSADTTRALWSKLIINCAFNALSACTRQPYGRIAAEPGAEQVLHDVVDECLAVARASGVEVPATIWEAVRAIPQTMAGQMSSTAQDILRGRPTEIDFLNGEIVRRGRDLGVPVPVNNALHVIVKLIEAGAAPAVTPSPR